MNHLLEAALRYAELGYRVFPCVPGKSTPLTENGFHGASVDPEQIEAWWAKYPAANIGIPTEGLLVVDIDGKDNEWPSNDQAADLTVGPMVTTPGGGTHHWFRQPDGKAWRLTQSVIAPKVDTRANGGYVVVPPSVRSEGKYEWFQELDVSPDRLPEPPQWLCDILDGAKRGVPLQITQEAKEGEYIVPEGQRNATLASEAGRMRRGGLSESVIRAALTQYNLDHCQPPLPQKEVDQVARSISRYEPSEVDTHIGRGNLHELYEIKDDEEPTDEDPGPIPRHLLRIPGFVSEVIDYTLETAPYPEPALAFCGALVLQGLLASRKVRDPSDNRTNLFILGLANSGSGKDHPRKVNQRILQAIGLEQCVGDAFASGEGIEDRVHANPCVLFQVDEIDSLMGKINQPFDPKSEGIMNILLKMFSAASGTYALRTKAGREHFVIDQPHLSLFGTAVPKHYYESLSPKMLTNGFLARMLVVEAGRRGKGQESLLRPVPDRVIESAQWWKDFNPVAGGNLSGLKPSPLTVDRTDDAQEILTAFREHSESQYDASEGQNDTVGTSIWARVLEKALRLSLAYACSEAPKAPRITVEAARWACDLVDHQTRRMLFMARSHVSDGQWDQKCKRLIQVLRDGQDDLGMSLSQIYRRLKWSKKEHDEVRGMLEAAGQIVVLIEKTPGRPKTIYRLLD